MLGVPGVNCWKHALPVLEHLNANRVVVAYDSDYHKEQVRIHARALVNEIRKNIKPVLPYGMSIKDSMMPS